MAIFGEGKPRDDKSFGEVKGKEKGERQRLSKSGSESDPDTKPEDKKSDSKLSDSEAAASWIYQVRTLLCSYLEGDKFWATLQEDMKNPTNLYTIDSG